MKRDPSSPLERKLGRFHRPLVDCVFEEYSPIAGPQFPGQFNLAAFYPALLRLADRPSSHWGIDRCLRIAESIDPWHSRVFHMGVFARSIARDDVAKKPWKDDRFASFQRDILGQFFALLEALSIPASRLEVSYFGGAILGGHPDGRDALLAKRTAWPADEISKNFLQERGVRSVAVPSIASVFIRPVEGSLVGPRLEVFFDGVELATIMFNCWRLERGELRPIHYVGAYGLGLERLLAIRRGGDFLHAIPRYVAAREIIVRRNPAARSHVLEREVLHVLFGLEALALIPEKISRAHAAQVLKLKAELKWFILNLGLSFREVRALFSLFRREQ